MVLPWITPICVFVFLHIFVFRGQKSSQWQQKPCLNCLLSFLWSLVLVTLNLPQVNIWLAGRHQLCGSMQSRFAKIITCECKLTLIKIHKRKKDRKEQWGRRTDKEGRFTARKKLKRCLKIWTIDKGWDGSGICLPGCESRLNFLLAVSSLKSQAFYLSSYN